MVLPKNCLCHSCLNGTNIDTAGLHVLVFSSSYSAENWLRFCHIYSLRKCYIIRFLCCHYWLTYYTFSQSSSRMNRGWRHFMADL